MSDEELTAWVEAQLAEIRLVIDRLVLAAICKERTLCAQAVAALRDDPGIDSPNEAIEEAVLAIRARGQG